MCCADVSSDTWNGVCLTFNVRKTCIHVLSTAIQTLFFSTLAVRFKVNIVIACVRQQTLTKWRLAESSSLKTFTLFTSSTSAYSLILFYPIRPAVRKCCCASCFWPLRIHIVIVMSPMYLTWRSNKSYNSVLLLCPPYTRNCYVI